MTSAEINKSIEKMSLHLSNSEKIDHWLNFIIIMAFLSIMSSFEIENAIKNKEFSLFVSIILILSGLLLRHKIISPTLTVYNTYLTEEQFKKANEVAAKLNDWLIKSNRKNYFSAIKASNLHWDGIKITAILKDGKLYLNSMVNPSSRANPITFGLNKKNKIELLRQYKSILNGNNINQIANNEMERREKEFWEESEFSIENLMMKLIAYPIGIGFLILSIWMLSTFEIKTTVLGLTTLGFVISYFYYDIKVIIEKRKRKKEQVNKSG